MLDLLNPAAIVLLPVFAGIGALILTGIVIGISKLLDKVDK
jgi:hypothetical protein